MEAVKIALATGNPHKAEELGLALRGCGVEVERVDVPKIEVQGESLEEIAALAASTAYHILHRPVLVEDAGLFIEALNGFPGPYSAYVYKTIGIKGILRLMEGVEDRRAVFVAVLALAHRGGVALFRGEARGSIAREPRGSGGFGYDPIFVPEGSSRTFAEMTPEEKNKFSHRGAAARALCSWLASTGPHYL